MVGRSGSEASKRLRVIRILAGPRPARTAAARLERIAEIAAGNASPDIFRNRNALRFDKPADEPEKKKRKRLGGHDRIERAGTNRSDDEES